MIVVCGIAREIQIPDGKIPAPTLDGRDPSQYRENVARMMAYTVIQRAGDDTKEFSEVLVSMNGVTGIVVCRLPDVPGAVPGAYPIRSIPLSEDKTREAAWIRQEDALLKARAKGTKVSKLPSDEHGREMELKRDRISSGTNVDFFASDMYVEASRYVLGLCGEDVKSVEFFLLV